MSLGSWNATPACRTDVTRVVDTADLAVLPDSVEFGAASTLPAAGVTALQALRRLVPVEDRHVLVVGLSRPR